MAGSAVGGAVAILGVGALVAVILVGFGARIGGLRDRLANRLYLGVPWGTLVVVSLVGCVYLFVQHGFSSPRDPVVIPYRAWSYQYPLGMIAAPFSHASLDHVLGNLTGAVVIAPIAEYAWGHYPRRRTADSGPSGVDPDSPWNGPRVRAFVLFPLFVCLVGLATSVFAVGPVIGFSGVVFAFAGFAIVHYPVATIVASLGVHGALFTLVRAVRDPITVTTVQSQPPAPPSWATIAIQAHALGFLLGVALAIAVIRGTGFRPDPGRLLIAVVLFGFSKSLWAIYWYGADGSYVLFRAPGVALVLALAALVTVAVTASDRPLVPGGDRTGESDGERDDRRESRFAGGQVLRRLRAGLTTGRARRLGGVPRRRTALSLLLVVLALLSGPAIALNAVAIDPGSADPAITVDGYAVTYEERAENRLLSVVPIDAFGSNETVTASGVIVWSTDRPLWTDAVSADRLAYSGNASVELGGPGWRETVTAERRGWNVVGNGSTYQVWLDSPSTDRTLAYESEPRRSSVEIAGASFVVASEDGTFVVRSESDDGTTTRTIPAPGESVSLGEVQLANRDEQLVAERGGTRAVIATAENYR